MTRKTLDPIALLTGSAFVAAIVAANWLTSTLVRCADVDEMTDADYDAQTEAAAVLLPLLEGAS